LNEGRVESTAYIVEAGHISEPLEFVGLVIEIDMIGHVIELESETEGLSMQDFE